MESLYSEKEEVEELTELSEEELKAINKKRLKVGLPLIDKYRNFIK